MSARANSYTGTEIVIESPYSKLHMTIQDAGCHALMRANQLAKLLLLIQPAAGPDDMLWLAQQMADEIVGALDAVIVGAA